MTTKKILKPFEQTEIEKQEHSRLSLIKTACIKQAQQEQASTTNRAPLPLQKIPIGINACDLLNKEFPAIKWIVPSILPEGCYLLCGKPKHGKSMLALNLGISISSGDKALGKEDIESGAVIYLALEDTQRRLKTRLETMLFKNSHEKVKDLHLFTEWPRMGEQGLELLEEEIQKHNNLRMVIIDTLAKFRPSRKTAGNNYDFDYQDIAALKTLADKYNICILIVHHLRKSESDDIMDNISGTLGLTGAADGTLVLARKTGNLDAVLYTTGRDIEQAEYALRFLPDSLFWEMIGSAQDIKNTEKKQILYDTLKIHASEKALSPKEIQEISGLTLKYINKTLPVLINEGDINRLTHGKYLLKKNINKGVNREFGEDGENRGKWGKSQSSLCQVDILPSQSLKGELDDKNKSNKSGLLDVENPHIPHLPHLPQDSKKLYFDENGKVLLDRGRA